MEHALFCSHLSTDESGRFIIWITSIGKRKCAVLHDTRNGQHVTLKRSGWDSGINKILFVEISKFVVLVTYSTGYLDLIRSTWDVSPSDCGPGEVASRRYRENLCGVCVGLDGKTLYLVTTDRAITRLTLPYLEELKNILIPWLPRRSN